MLNLAAIQFDIQWESPEANRKYLEEVISEYQTVADVIILPEMFNTGFSINVSNIAEIHEGPTVQWMSDIANRYDCAICGSIPTKVESRYVNRFYWVESESIQFYDKKHLFGYGKESEVYSSGASHLIVEYKGYRIMPLVCYDLRFPVWSRNTQDFDLLLYVANWPDARASAWRQLLRARAIENLCYVCGVNRVGTDGVGLHYIGDTAIIDYQGVDVAILKDEITTLKGTIDKTKMIAFRNEFNFLNDRDEFTLV